MSDVVTEIQGKLCLLTLNRVSKQNAFDNALLTELHNQLSAAILEPAVRVIVLKANGQHFCAGADIGWMQHMVEANEADNLADSMVLARLMHAFYQCPKPTIAMIQGSAFGGGAGLAAVCDVAFAATNARFCFSEVRLGLIPAVISPYIVQAIGARNAQKLFMSAELFDAESALSYGLIQGCLPADTLLESTLAYANSIANNAPEAVQMAKKLVKMVAGKAIDEALIGETARLIARKRVSAEGQKGLQAFLKKEKPDWNEDSAHV